jgi:hypothetical protein
MKSKAIISSFLYSIENENMIFKYYVCKVKHKLLAAIMRKA